MRRLKVEGVIPEHPMSFETTTGQTLDFYAIKGDVVVYKPRDHRVGGKLLRALYLEVVVGWENQGFCFSVKVGRRREIVRTGFEHRAGLGTNGLT